jgi:hypothetical protein
MLGCHPMSSMWCEKFKRSAATRAHDFVVAVIAKWARLAGIMVHIEVRPLFDQIKKIWPNRLRPDILLVFPTHPEITLLYSDVTLSFLGSPCYRKAAARNSKNAVSQINSRGNAKRKKYNYLCKDRHYASFLAAAASRAGVLGDDICNLITKIADFATANSGNTLSSIEIAKTIRQDVTVAIQSGNTSFIRESIARGARMTFVPSIQNHSDIAALERANQEAQECLAAIADQEDID